MRFVRPSRVLLIWLTAACNMDTASAPTVPMVPSPAELPGVLAVRVSTQGHSRDSDGYFVSVYKDGTEVTTLHVDVDAEVTVGLRPGAYTMWLWDLAPQCQLIEFPIPFIGFLAVIEREKTTVLAFHVVCSAAADG